MHTLNCCSKNTRGCYSKYFQSISQETSPVKESEEQYMSVSLYSAAFHDIFVMLAIFQEKYLIYLLIKICYTTYSLLSNFFIFVFLFMMLDYKFSLYFKVSSFIYIKNAYFWLLLKLDLMLWFSKFYWIMYDLKFSEYSYIMYMFETSFS